MTWVKVDDGFAEHPDVVGLSDAAFRLLVASFCYCGRNNTDGRLARGALAMPPKRVRELIAAGRWHQPGHECECCPPVAPGTYYVHKFLAYNPSAEEVEVTQGRRSEKARKAARARWDKPPSNAPSMPDAKLETVLADAPVPNPSVVTSLPSTSEPPESQPVDDEKSFAEPTPIDRLEVTVRAVFDRCAEARMKGIAPNAPGPYRARVLANLETEHGTDLRRIIQSHASAPVETLAGYVLGEPNSLSRYREATA